MTIMANAATVVYNGYAFDGATKIKIRCEPVYDDSDRVVTMHHYTVNIVGVIAGDIAGATTEPEMQQIRALLTKASMPLMVFQAGFYDLIVNQAGGVTDCAFGPKPRMVSWTPIGASHAAEFEWECETWIAFCDDGTDPVGPIVLVYGAEFALDVRGLTTRTLAGYLEIALNRTVPGGQAIPHVVDEWRERIDAAIPERFHRTTQNFKISLDKRRLDFSVVDQEIAENNPYPEGAAKVEGRHRVGWTRRAGGAGRLRNTISINIELAPNQPLLNAYAIFSVVAKSRIDIARAAYGNAVMLEDVHVEEDLYGREASFAVSYTVCAPLGRLLADLGLWQPLGFNTWGQWATSIGDVKDVRGFANMKLDANQDTLIDPCKTIKTIEFDNVPINKIELPELTRTLLKNETPPADGSWLEYESHVYMFRDRALVRQAIMQAPEAEDPTFYPNITGDINYPATGRTVDIMQRSGKSRYTAALIGHAKRAGHKVPRPALSSIGSAAATEIKGDFFMRISGNWLGVPVYDAAWCILYSLATEPGYVEPMENVKEGVAADGTTVQPTGP